MQGAATAATARTAIAGLVVGMPVRRRVACKREFGILLERNDREAAKRKAAIHPLQAPIN